MAKICFDALKTANTDLSIMIVGETGSGKSFLAKAIHNLSNRRKEPFKVLNCGSISSDINWLMSELFGHKEKSFNEALNRFGILSDVKGGTLLLDEVIEIPYTVQSGLLSVIETKKYRRLGENIEREFSGRIISTSNRPISEVVREKKFREDLKFRLCQEVITIPPLRDRVQDIPAITKNYLENSKDRSLKIKEISEESLILLQRQPWTGNVRQLLSVISRASAYETSKIITLPTIKEELLKEYSMRENDTDLIKLLDINVDLEVTIDQLRKEQIIKALKENNGNISAASRVLGYSTHQSLHYWLKEYKIEPKGYKN